MSVVTRQTLILKTCDRARQEPESNKFFGENGAFLNFSLTGEKAEAKITFIKKFDFSGGVTLVFRFNDFKGAFKLNKNGESVFSAEFKLSNAAERYNSAKNLISALILCDGEPRFFACSLKSGFTIADGYNGYNAELSEFKELKNFYEKNYKTNGERVAENEASVFRQEKIDRNADEPNDANRTYAERKAGAIEYDDEAVATENYYDLNAQKSGYKPVIGTLDSSDDLKKGNFSLNDFNLGDINDAENENDKTENYKEKKEDDLQNYENARTFNSDAQSQTEKAAQSGINSFENGALNRKHDCACIYDTMKEEIEGLFEKYPPEPALNELVPNSRWVKINYGNGKHYVVGVINFNGTPAHIAYGIEGNRKLRPEKMRDYSLFLPASQYSLTDDGYWCMLQSAKTGRTEK